LLLMWYPSFATYKSAITVSDTFHPFSSR